MTPAAFHAALPPDRLSAVLAARYRPQWELREVLRRAVYRAGREWYAGRAAA
jgi:hypothetical protein